MTYRSHIDEKGGVALPRRVLEQAGLHEGDTVAIEHVEPGVIRFRRTTPITFQEIVELHRSDADIDDFEELARQGEQQMADEYAAKMEELRRVR